MSLTIIKDEHSQVDTCEFQALSAGTLFRWPEELEDICMRLDGMKYIYVTSGYVQEAEAEYWDTKVVILTGELTYRVNWIGGKRED